MEIDTDFTAPTIEWFALSPYIALVVGMLIMLLVGALTPAGRAVGMALRRQPLRGWQVCSQQCNLANSPVPHHARW